MSKKVATVGFWLGVLTGLLAGGTAWGKPADLPDNHQIECADGKDDPPMPRKFSLELDFTPNGITLKFGPGADQPAEEPQLPAFIEQWLQHVGDLLARPERVFNLENLLSKLPRPAPAEKSDAEGVEQLFRLAERQNCERHYQAARFLYQRVHLLAPTSRVGRLAIDRLQQVEERLRNDAEEADTPGGAGQPESMHRDMHKGLVPLGLVRVRY
jgi:hypothetical protein